jgi:hypothetical protein
MPMMETEGSTRMMENPSCYRNHSWDGSGALVDLTLALCFDDEIPHGVPDHLRDSTTSVFPCVHGLAIPLEALRQSCLGQAESEPDFPELRASQYASAYPPSYWRVKPPPPGGGGRSIRGQDSAFVREKALDQPEVVAHDPPTPPLPSPHRGFVHAKP